jgi:hypothetical protein
MKGGVMKITHFVDKILHDVDAMSDGKVVRFISNFVSNCKSYNKSLLLRYAAYGFYWKFLEILRSHGLEIDKNDTEFLKIHLNLDENQLKLFLNCIEKSPMFKIDNNMISCPTLTKRTLKMLEEKENLTKNGKKGAQVRWHPDEEEVCDRNATAMRPHQKNDATAMPINIINKDQIKEDKKKHKNFVYLSDFEFEKLKEKHGLDITNELIEKLDNYIVSLEEEKQNKYLRKNHYGKILSWVEGSVLTPERKAQISKAREQERQYKNQQQVFKEALDIKNKNLEDYKKADIFYRKLTPKEKSKVTYQVNKVIKESHKNKFTPDLVRLVNWQIIEELYPNWQEVQG